MAVFNEHLRSIRQSQKKTQKETAIAIGANERNYQDWEYGRNKPGFDSLVSLADYFNVSIDYLVGRTNNPNMNQ